MNDVPWGPVTTLSSARQKVGRPEAAHRRGRRRRGDAGTGARALPRSHRGYVGQVQMSERMQRRVVDDRAAHLDARSLCTSGRRSAAVAVGAPRARGHLVAVRPDRRAQHRDQRQPRPRRDLRRGAGAARSGPSATCRPISPSSASGRAVAVSAGSGGTLDWWRGDVGTVLALSGLPALGSSERLDEGARPRGDRGQRHRRRPLGLDRPDRPAARRVDRLRPRRERPRQPVGAARAPRTTRASRWATARRGIMAWVTDGRVVASTRGAGRRGHAGRGDLRARRAPRRPRRPSRWTRRLRDRLLDPGRAGHAGRGAHRGAALPDVPGGAQRLV